MKIVRSWCSIARMLKGVLHFLSCEIFVAAELLSSTLREAKGTEVLCASVLRMWDSSLHY